MNAVEAPAAARARSLDGSSASTPPWQPQVANVGLVHDYLLTARGAERTFSAIASCWPEAPIYTTLFDYEQLGDRFARREVVTSGLQRLGVGQKSFRALLPLFPRAVEHLPVADHEIVISSSSAFAHGVRPGAHAIHVSYCHSPFRYAWHEHDRTVADTPAPLRPVMRRVLARIRAWDTQAATRVTHFVANSQITQRRIEQLYDRDSTVIHPPVDVDRFAAPQDPHGYLLYVGEITAHKRVEVAIEAAGLAKRKIVIVGDGPDRRRLETLHAGHAKFVGRVPDAKLTELFAHADALIVPNVEEFGIAAVEAQAAGRPVVAIAAGGTRETVIDGTTGVLVERGGVDDFAEALRHTDFSNFAGPDIAAHAKQFSVARFQRELSEFVSRCGSKAAT
ncbi:MAG: glycosyltransferase [Solirubrobacterales bacterium]